MTNPRRMRRHARRMRRYGMQPMVVINSGDPLPDLVIVTLARWLWRYRSELAPLILATMTALAAWILHAAHPHWWLALAAVTVAAMAGAGMTGRRFGLVTVAERGYAMAVIAATGGWLAAATAAGPSGAPLPGVLLVSACVLGVPWWAHRRRRARVRVERLLAAWPQIAPEVGLAGSRVMAAVVDVWGWRAVFGLARGQTIADVIARLPALESALGTFRGAARVFPTPDGLANRFELRVLDKDPHADAITWPGPSVQSITEPIDLGPFEDAMPCTVLLLRRHGLFGGGTGSGKSGGVNVLMGNLTACIDVVIWAVDLKRGMKLGPWAECLGRLATTPAEARALLADAVAILEARAACLAEIGKRVWEPAPDMPALVIIVDEYAELTESAPDATGDADSIGRRGRAVAVTLIAATQRPTQKAMGQGALRSQMDVRICFRVRERKDVDLVLGQGMLSAGWHAHKLNAPGKFLISAPEHDTPRRVRAYLLTDEAVSATASRHAGLRPELDEVSRAALGDSGCRPPESPGERTSPGAAVPAPLASPSSADGPASAEDALWFALCMAPPEGADIGDLMRLTGMSRPTLYRHLASHARVGRAIQVSRGRWRATTTPEP
ncbi:MAG TPA: cell division protein FtsK [Streptosporangiaceae bacterium]|nr:cell division protein FtsK [Streptosporangiaceae bacterium]